MRRIAPFLLLLLVACGGSDGGPADPGNGVDPPRPLDYAYLNRLPQPDGLSAVSESGGRAIAVGAGGAVVIREPGETSWRRVQAPTRATFNAVRMIDATTVLATNFEGTWLSLDGGVNWKQVDATDHMREITFRNGRAVVGGLFGIIHSTDLENWELAADTPTSIIDVGFAGDSVIWAMSANEMHRSTDGGKNWVKVIEGSGQKAFAYADENFGTLCVLGGEIKGTTNGTTFLLVADVVIEIIDVDFKDPDLGVLVTRDGHVYTSETRGKSWTFEGQFDLEFSPADIELTSAGEVLVVGRAGQIAETTGGMTTFVEISSGISSDLHNLALATSREGLACEDAFDVPLFRTTNGGETWVEIASPVLKPRDLAFHIDEFALILDGDGDVFRSDDLGDTWVDMGASSEAFMTCLLISDRETWMAGGNRFIARTDDSGTSWSLTPVELLVNGMDRFPGTDVVLAVGNDVIRSEDGGETWSGPVPGVVNGRDVACLDENVAVTVAGDIYRTADQGLTWENVLDVPEELQSVVFLDDLHGIAVGEDGYIVETLDGGLTWIEVEIFGGTLLAVASKGQFGGGVLMVGEDGAVIGGTTPPE